MAEDLSCSFASFLLATLVSKIIILYWIYLFDDSAYKDLYLKCGVGWMNVNVMVTFIQCTYCTKDVRCYIWNVKVSQTTLSTVLILAPAGLLSVDVVRRTIFPRHWANLGLMWMPKRKCSPPQLGTRKKQPEMGGGFHISKYITARWNVLVGAG